MLVVVASILAHSFRSLKNLHSAVALHKSLRVGLFLSSFLLTVQVRDGCHRQERDRLAGVHRTLLQRLQR